MIPSEESVQMLEVACHRLLRSPKDDGYRALLLEALATYKGVPLDCFPSALRDLVVTSREQADALCLRILETSALEGGSIEAELKEVCHTLAELDGRCVRRNPMRPGTEMKRCNRTDRPLP